MSRREETGEEYQLRFEQQPRSESVIVPAALLRLWAVTGWIRAANAMEKGQHLRAYLAEDDAELQGLTEEKWNEFFADGYVLAVVTLTAPTPFWVWADGHWRANSVKIRWADWPDHPKTKTTCETLHRYYDLFVVGVLFRDAIAKKLPVEQPTLDLMGATRALMG